MSSLDVNNNGDNGKLKEKQPEVIEMRIVLEPGKPCIVHFPLLMDKVASYGFLKIAEKTLDMHYSKIEKQHIIPAKGGIIDFVRRRR